MSKKKVKHEHELTKKVKNILKSKKKFHLDRKYLDDKIMPNFFILADNTKTKNIKI